MLSIGFELAWDTPCEELIPNRIIAIGLMKVHPISTCLEKKRHLEFDPFYWDASTLFLHEDDKPGLLQTLRSVIAT